MAIERPPAPGLFAPPRPRVFSIPAGAAFTDRLAAALIAEAGGAPEALADMTVLVPTRRAVRTLAEAFLRAAPDAQAAILPRLMPLGDVDADALVMTAADGPVLADLLDLAPPIGPRTRQAMLAEQVLKHPHFGFTPASAFALAGDLGRLIDQVHTHRLSFDRLADLVPDELATHWQVTLKFLRIVTEHWPHILADQDREDPARHRIRLMAALTARWQADPPAGPVIAAGSTGSLPATADLLAVVAGLPQGAVVLPGLDQTLDAESWHSLDDSHPQIAMRDLLERIGCRRGDVRPWPGTDPRQGADRRPDRARLVSEVMRPAATSQDWRALADGGLATEAIAGLARIDAANSREEAQVIALLLREALEEPGRTAALITPDRALARRVAAALGRWGLAVDDSGGRPLAATPVGTFLALLADTAAAGFPPVALLGLLKHPLAAAGGDPAALRRQARRLDRRVLRGPRPAPGLAGLGEAVRQAVAARGGDDGGLPALAARLADLLGPLAAALGGPPAPPTDLLRLHIDAAEALAASPTEPGAAALWAGEDGETAAALTAELAEAFAALAPIRPGDYPALFAQAMADAVVRPRFGTHPRLAIWGPLEARLQQADRIILGGLNEGTWPAETSADPWMSRPMRQRFGLPAPERRIGLAAHDFTQALAGAEVLLTRAGRVDGTPQMPSRWLLRLDAVLTAAGLELDQAADRWRHWAAAIDRPAAVTPARPPAPTPPAGARPDRYSASDIALLRTNPYAVYARRVLGLRVLDALEADPDAADRGEVVHAALADWLHPARADAAPTLAALLALLDRELAPLAAAYPAITAIWRPRLERAAAWFVETQSAIAADRQVVAVEATGALTLALPGGPVRVEARADRIDRRADGALIVVDYKTGGVPSAGEIVTARAPQLAIEALIAEAGGFAGIEAAPVAGLEYWRLGGGASNTGLVSVGGAAPNDLIAAARDGLTRLLARFAEAEMPFLAHPWGRPDRADNYDHLARLDEWSSGGAP